MELFFFFLKEFARFPFPFAISIESVELYIKEEILTCTLQARCHPKKKTNSSFASSVTPECKGRSGTEPAS